MHATFATLLAIGWQPELRGIIIVIIAVGVLMGSVYLVLATNLGARLGFLVTLAALFGWLAMMGFVWMIYGIGLQGPLGSWKEVPGRTVLQDTSALVESEVLNDQVQVPDGVSFSEESAAVAQAFEDEGWERLDSSSQEFGQAGAAAGTFAEAVGAYAAGDFVVNGVYDTGGERYPLLFGSDSLDFLAFFHEPRHVVVELAPIIPTYTEAGRAPAAAQIDETGQPQYVYMVRDLGARRQPATVLAIGGSIIFLTLCWLLHRRDRFVTANRSALPVAAD